MNIDRVARNLRAATETQEPDNALAGVVMAMWEVVTWVDANTGLADLVDADGKLSGSFNQIDLQEWLESLGEDDFAALAEDGFDVSDWLE